ncbi:MAG: hypothetical protein KKC68_04715, partial [Candidatus Thermoplasmatota archaeon]|nr:hypothetical protein [Candidatus Thermoplasmatota archaeon]MBU1941054.1 hypothetical protein [Candidatus Thermoplasmatota archaeon]
LNEPVIFENVNANKVLEKYWIDHGKSYLKSIIADEDMVTSFYQLDEPPSSILKFVDEYKERQTILDKYPHYTKLPSLAHFIDTLVKTYLTFGKEKAITILKQHPDNHKGRSVAYAFALEFSKAKDFKWKFTAEEIESGDFLQTYVNHVLTCDPKKYAKCVQDILIACGSNEKLPE